MSFRGEGNSDEPHLSQETDGTNTGAPGDPEAWAEEPGNPLSFLFAAVIFVAAWFSSYGITVTRSLGVDVIKECHYREIDNVAGGLAMLFLAVSYALTGEKIIRKDVLHHSIFALVAVGGLYLLYTAYQVWPDDCLNELQYIIQLETWS